MKHVSGEVFVVDNNSIDGSVAMVKDKFPHVHLIDNKDNVGFSKANNQAMKIAKGEYVLLLNPDTVVEESTFEKVVKFMDEHPDAGGLGVKMLDGKGAFLPESKRGLPTPAVAFYKIFGLSRLFPKSRKFGRYHLGYLDDDKTHEIEILSGAFMLMRKEALDKVGLLDEAFFMYGEDIDLSYRIIKGGYKNYYFPDTRIIHYKGESTKKSSVNYVFVFYNAMIIFAKKHFSQKNAKLFSFLINLAIYFRAGLAIANRLVKKSILPIIDLALITSLLFGISHWYQKYSGIEFPENLTKYAIPIYGLTWVICNVLFGSYDRPIKLIRLLYGSVLGSVLIFSTYAFLDKSYQFSRAFLLLGSVGTLLYFSVSRLFLSLAGVYGYSIKSKRHSRFAIVGSIEECERVHNLLQQTHPNSEEVLYVTPDSAHEVSEKYVGKWNQINQICHIHKIDELIFCAKDVTARDTISAMSKLEAGKLDFKIAQPETLFLIGSNSIDTSGDLYMLDLHSINSPTNRRNKRMFDLVSSIVILASLPVSIWFVKKKLSFVSNIFSTLLGRTTWVGYSTPSQSKKLQLPSLKKGIISPICALQSKAINDEITERLDIIYAKSYRISTDLKLLLKCFPFLGQ